MERRLRNDGEAMRKKVRSAGRPSELSERLERLVSHFAFLATFDIHTWQQPCYRRTPKLAVPQRTHQFRTRVLGVRLMFLANFRTAKFSMVTIAAQKTHDD